MIPIEALEQHARVVRWLDSPGSGGVGSGSLDTWLIRESVREGHTTFIRAEISEALRVASRGYPNTPLYEADLPFTNGFAWFERPLELRPGATPLRPPIQAMSWLVRRDRGLEGLFFVVWLAGIIGGGGLYGESNEWPYGVGWQQVAPAVPAVTIPPGEREFATRNAHEEARFFGSLCAFMKQQILVATLATGDRHTRKRVEREGMLHEPLVRVIELRRREYPAREQEPGEVADVDWSCRWIVRGHWRQQFYPSKQQTQPIWILPYVKGPDDKPLRPPRATVFAVVR